MTMTRAEARARFGTEKGWARTVDDYARLCGWEILKTWLSINSPSGEPDRKYIRPPRVVWAELKTARGKVSPRQEYILGLLRLCNQEAYLWYPADWPEIERVLGEGRVL